MASSQLKIFRFNYRAGCDGAHISLVAWPADKSDFPRNILFGDATIHVLPAVRRKCFDTANLDSALSRH